MTHRTGDRCPADLRSDARLKLAAVEAARIARRPAPPTDWQCVREPHDTGSAHLAMPLGTTGPTQRFTDDDAQYPVPATDQADAPPRPPAELAALVDQLTRAGVGVVHAHPGDTLLLLVPAAGNDHAERLVRDLAAYVPHIGILALAGVAGGVVVRPPGTHEPYCNLDTPHPGPCRHLAIDQYADRPSGSVDAANRPCDPGYEPEQASLCIPCHGCPPRTVATTRGQA